MLLGLAVLVVSWMAAVQVTGKEQAGCDETYAGAHRLNGSSWSEFRERCIATSGRLGMAVASQPARTSATEKPSH